MNHPKLQKLAIKAQGTLVRRVVRLPKPILRKIAGKPTIIEGQTFDLSLQVMLKLFGPPPNQLASVADTRAMIDVQGAWLAQPENQDIIADEFKLEVSGGDTQHHNLKQRSNQPIFDIFPQKKGKPFDSPFIDDIN